MRKFVIFILSAALALPAFAQTTVKTTTEETVEYSKDKYRVQTAGPKANWFVGVAAGPQVYFGDGDKAAAFGKRISPDLEIYVGKWFTPSIGFRFLYNGLYYKGAAPDVTGAYVNNKFNYFNLQVDGMLNLCNLFCGWKEDRFWNCSPYAGVGYGRTYDAPTQNEITGHLGIYNALRLSKSVDFTIDLRSMLTNDRFDKDCGGRRFEGALSLSFGFAYKFAPRGWSRPKTVTKTITEDVSGILKELEDLKAENDDLAQEVDSLRNRKPEEIHKVNVISSPYYVVFEIAKSTLSSEGKANLAILAEIIKSNNLHYTITGYADEGTGNEAINQRLSRERAQAVYDCLVKEYNVPASMLKIDYKGGVGNMFYDDPSLSRAVITRND
ncbi:MAG: OmpA family protein [Candidatus Cryptobacteroides sp.]